MCYNKKQKWEPWPHWQSRKIHQIGANQTRYLHSLRSKQSRGILNTRLSCSQSFAGSSEFVKQSLNPLGWHPRPSVSQSGFLALPLTPLHDIKDGGTELSSQPAVAPRTCRHFSVSVVCSGSSLSL